MNSHSMYSQLFIWKKVFTTSLYLRYQIFLVFIKLDNRSLGLVRFSAVNFLFVLILIPLML